MVTQKSDLLPEKSIWDQMKTHIGGTPSPGGGGGTHGRALLPRLMVWLILFVSVTYLAYALRLVSTSHPCPEEHPFSTSRRLFNTSSSDMLTRNQTMPRPEPGESQQRTELRHIVFGIAASAKLWDKRKNYIKLWYVIRPGFLFLLSDNSLFELCWCYQTSGLIGTSRKRWEA